MTVAAPTPAAAGFDFRGRRALVTGGTHAAGRATALLLAHAGARVIVCTEPGDPDADALAIDLKEIGDDHLVLSADIGDAIGATALVQACRSHLGGLDVIVHDAALRPGAHGFGGIVDGTLRSAYLVIRHGAELLPEGSAIVAIATTADGIGAATATAGLFGLTRSFAAELGPAGIRVNLVTAASAEPYAIATVVAFLAGTGAAGVTGETIPVGGVS